MLAQYAAGLAIASSGAAFAELRPLPRRRTDEIRRYELALYASAHPATKLTLFTVRQLSGENIRIQGLDEDQNLGSIPDVIFFLQRLGNTEETKMAIERLLLAAAEVQSRASR